MTRGIAEILEMAAKEQRDMDKITVLHMNDTPQLRKMIKYILDPQVVWWEFLKGSPAPYTPNRYLDAEGRLFAELRKMYMFCESGDEWMQLNNDNYLTRFGLQRNPKKRERVWIEILESISPADAALLCAAPNRKFPFEGLSRELIDQAYPGLLSPEPEVGQPPIISTTPVEDPIAPSHGIAPQRPATQIIELSVDDILNG